MGSKRPLWIIAISAVIVSTGLLTSCCTRDDDFSPEFLAELAGVTPQETYEIAAIRTSAELSSPLRLQADGEPIDIGKLSAYAHAGPWLADLDGDGDRDLLIGSFPGHFWLFDNEGSEAEPVYTAKGKLQAGGEDAKTPVY